MSDFGHVKISRKAYTSDPLWNEPREFSRWEAWEWMIQAAAWKPYRKVTKRAGAIAIERGETPPLAERFLADTWGWGSKNRARRFLELLHEMGRIRTGQRTADGTTYHLVNYDSYQSTRTADGPETDQTRTALPEGSASSAVKTDRTRTACRTKQTELDTEVSVSRGPHADQNTDRSRTADGPHADQNRSSKAGKAVKAVEGQVDIQPLHAMDQIDPDLLINGVIRAANAGMIDNPLIDQDAFRPILVGHGDSRQAVADQDAFRPILVGHGDSRQAVADWFAAGIPWETAVEAVYYAAEKYRPTPQHRQVRSLSYFDNPVRDRHEADAARAFPRPQRTPGVSVHPDAEVNSVRSETPGARRVAEGVTGTQPFRLSRIIEEMQQQGFRVPAAKKAGGVG